MSWQRMGRWWIQHQVTGHKICKVMIRSTPLYRVSTREGEFLGIRSTLDDAKQLVQENTDDSSTS